MGALQQRAEQLVHREILAFREMYIEAERKREREGCR
jgi:hypothetical protein